MLNNTPYTNQYKLKISLFRMLINYGKSTWQIDFNYHDYYYNYLFKDTRQTIPIHYKNYYIIHAPCNSIKSIQMSAHFKMFFFCEKLSINVIDNILR